MSSFPSPKAPLQAVIFDLDGLMFNTEDLYQEVGRDSLARRGKQLTQELLDEMMGRKSDIALQIMIDRHDLEISVEDLATEQAESMRKLIPTRLQPLPGLLSLLAALEAGGIPKAIATSSGRQFVTQVLGQSQLEPRFDFVFTSEDIENGKPAPDVYLLAASSLGFDPARTMVLEDTQIGCRAATAAGAYTVAVPGEHSRDHDFNGVKFIATALSDRRIYQALSLPVTDCEE
ncbi:MAG: HAD family phosphatase [Planctomycetales bacterium]|nr:HAD family phosphatase [Planctomycetales bacterium]